MASGDLYQLIDHQDFGGQKMLNVYWFYQTLGAGGAQDLATDWVAHLSTELRAIQSSLLTHESVSVINLDDDSDFYELAWVANNLGSVGGDVLPLFTAWGFRYNRSSRSTRHGYKRVPGVAEADTNAGQASAGVLARLAALETKLAADVVGGNGTWSPRIVKITGSSPNLVYTPAGVASVQFYAVTSQNSRKTGRGS